MNAPEPAKRRLFVGLALDGTTRAACARASETLQRTGFAAKFEDAQKFHVTMAFLGNVDAARFDDVVAAMRGAASVCAPLEVVLDRVGAFPHERKPRIVYVGAREQGAAFRELAHAVREAYGALGFALKDDSVAHVTIARIKDPRRPLPLVEVEPTRVAIAALSLFESIFDREQNTTRYEIVASSPLTAG